MGQLFWSTNVDKKYGKLNIVKYVALPQAHRSIRPEKRVILASFHCHLEQCKRLIQQFKDVNPDIRDIHGIWTYNEEILD